MVFFCFRTEAGYDVRGNGAVRKDFSDGLYLFKVIFPCVFAVHLFQHTSAAALHGQVYVRADVRIHGHCIEHSLPHIFWMGCLEADPHVRAGQGYEFEQL